MKVTTNYKSRKGSGTGIIVAKGNGKQKTVEYDHGLSVSANHGRAARALVEKVVPSWRRADVLNSVECIEARSGKTVFNYRY